jgi:hypothetical protein
MYRAFGSIMISGLTLLKAAPFFKTVIGRRGGDTIFFENMS